MTLRARTCAINYGAGGNTVKEGVELLENEFALVYTLLNKLYRKDATVGNAAPTAPEVYDLWFCTSPRQLMFWDGAAWIPIAGAGPVGGSSRMYLTRGDADTLRIPASLTAPAGVSVDGVAFQNTADTDLDCTGLTGTFDVVASRSGTTRNFALSAETSPYSVAAGERIVGTIVRTGGDFGLIRSNEVQDPAGYLTPRHLFTSTLEGHPFVCTPVIDLDGNGDASGFTVPEDGYYQLVATGRSQVSGGNEPELTMTFSGIADCPTIGTYAHTSGKPYSVQLAHTAYLAPGTVVLPVLDHTGGSSIQGTPTGTFQVVFLGPSGV